MATTKSKKANRRPKGSGSIYFDSKRNKYVGQIVVKLGDDSQKKKTVSGKTKKEVSNKLRDIQFLVFTGELPELKQQEIPTVYQYAEKLMDEQLALNEIRQSSYDRKKETLKRLSEISDKPLNELSEDDIVDFFKNQLNYSQSYINKMYQLLGEVYRKALKRQIVDKNPLMDIKCPKSNKITYPVRALTVEEQKKLIDVLKTENIRYSDIMFLSLFTGMRIGECCALMVEDIDFNKKSIFVHQTVSRGKFGETTLTQTKTAAGTRKIFASDEVLLFLKAIIGNRQSGLLFRSSNNCLVTTNQVNASYSNVIKNYKIVDSTVYGKVDLHSLRHTYATRCIESGMPAKVLQTILGHSNIKITLDIYCSVFEEFSNEHQKAVIHYLKENDLTILDNE